METKRQTNPVSGSDDATLRRLGEIVRDAIGRIFGTNPFQMRNAIQQPIILPRPDGSPGKLEWGTLNRVAVVSTGIQRAQLPRIRAEWVGHPLLVSIAVPTGLATLPALVPGGVNVAGGVPRVNGSSTGITASGIRTAITDGIDWGVY